MTHVNIPDSVTVIGNQAFQNCANVTHFEIGADSQLTSIGASAFFNCANLTGITIPSGVTNIDVEAFANCSKLTSVTFKNPVGWWYTEDIEATEGEGITKDLSNPEMAATALRATYRDYYWRLSEIEIE